MEDIKTEKGKKINRKTLIVTRDIAQEKHMAYFRCPDGREEKAFVVFNRREEYDQNSQSSQNSFLNEFIFSERKGHGRLHSLLCDLSIMLSRYRRLTVLNLWTLIRFLNSFGISL